jgi:hypothetical protein
VYLASDANGEIDGEAGLGSGGADIHGDVRRFRGQVYLLQTLTGRLSRSAWDPEFREAVADRTAKSLRHGEHRIYLVWMVWGPNPIEGSQTSAPASNCTACADTMNKDGHSEGASQGGNVIQVDCIVKLVATECAKYIPEFTPTDPAHSGSQRSEGAQVKRDHFVQQRTGGS